MSQAWTKFRELSFRERLLLAAAIVSLPLVHLALRLIGFRRLCKVLAFLRPFRAQSSDTRTGEHLLRARVTAPVVTVAANRGIFRPNCLDKSVALWWLLRLQGIHNEIRIGVRKGSQFEAHAWVELGAVVVNDRDDVGRTFEPFTDPLLRNMSMR